MRFIDSRQSIDEPFKRTEHTISKRAFPFKNTGHIESQRLCAKQYQCKKEKNLKPAVRRHDEYFLLKLFRAQQRVHQINEQSHSDKTKCKRFDHLCVSFAPSRAHPMAYPIAMTKNNTLAPTLPISHMVLPPAQTTRSQNLLLYLDQSSNQVFAPFRRLDMISTI
jgi:hypothetical protein